MRQCNAPDRGDRALRIVQVNYAFDPALESPGALLDTYHTLVGWSDAIAAAGVSSLVVQAFTGDAQIRRGPVDYVFRRLRRSRLRAAGDLHRAAVDVRPDVVHVNGLDAPLRTWQLRRMLAPEVAIVVQDHAGQPPEPVSATGIARRHVMRAADAFLFTSTAQAIDWVRGGFIDPSRVYDVPEASTTLRPVERATARAISGIVGQPAVLWVGRLDANKDPLTVLDGFERALTALPGATLTMVYGEGRLEAEVRDRVAASRALEGRVRLAGRVPHDQLASWYTAADIFVLGSRREGSGYALIEACACGATPVVTDIPAFAAITGHGAVGALWPRGDADALACALVAAARRDPEHERRRIVEHFATHLSWDVVGARARSIYEAVRDRRLARRGRCGPA